MAMVWTVVYWAAKNKKGIYVSYFLLWYVFERKALYYH